MDRVSVHISGNEFVEFSEFTIDADVHSMADTFSFTGTNPTYGRVPVGSWVDVFIGVDQIMRGCVMSVTSTVGSSGRSYTFSGVDVCGLLDKVQYDRYKTLTNVGIVEAAQFLTKELNWKRRLSFRVDAKAQPVSARKSFVISPGQTIGERLSNLAIMRGLLMFAEPSGEIVFGKLVQGGAPYHEVVVGSDLVTDSSITWSIENGGSKVTVISQETESGSSRERYSVSVKGFPTVDLPVIIDVESDDSTPKCLAEARALEIRRDLMRYEISMAGFRCGAGKVWGINKLCRVTDSYHGDPVDQMMVCVKRSFSQSRSGGSVTRLTLAMIERA